MPFIRKYAKNRLKPGERLWWIDDQPDERTLPLEVRLYTKLSQPERGNTEQNQQCSARR
jgi:hypothetical protein